MKNKCEFCGNPQFPSNAHRHKRYKYSKRPEMLKDENQVMTLCAGGSRFIKNLGGCHTFFDSHPYLLEALFLKFRGEDNLEHS